MAKLTGKPYSGSFVCCKGGISHHPTESATEADVAVAIGVMKGFVSKVVS